jgi:hypothetical protein
MIMVVIMTITDSYVRWVALLHIPEGERGQIQI